MKSNAQSRTATSLVGALAIMFAAGASHAAPALVKGALSASDRTLAYDEVQNTMGRYVAYMANGPTLPDALNLFDLASPRVSFWLNKGPGSAPALVGPQAVRGQWASFESTLAKNGGSRGEHTLTSPVIVVAPDGKSAKGEWQDLGTTVLGPATIPPAPVWPDGSNRALRHEVGRYDGTFVKTATGWKISSLEWTVLWQTTLEELDATSGWIKHPSDPLPLPPTGG